MTDQHWTMCRVGAGYVLIDGTGRVRAQFKNADVLAEHYVFAVQEVDRLRAEQIQRQLSRVS